jgi:hypothetical protein
VALAGLTSDIFSSFPGQLGFLCRIVPPADTIEHLPNGLLQYPFTIFHLPLRAL